MSMELFFSAIRSEEEYNTLPDLWKVCIDDLYSVRMTISWLTHESYSRDVVRLTVTLGWKARPRFWHNTFFVGHEIDARSINMSQKCIQSAVQFAKPGKLTEIYFFLDLLNNFWDHIPQHFAVQHALYQMISGATKLGSKRNEWTLTQGEKSFSALRN